MATFLLRRLGLMFLTLWILSLIVFFAGQISPRRSRSRHPRAVRRQKLRADPRYPARRQPAAADRVPELIGGLLHGNFGASYSYRTAVEPFVRAALINSVKLAVLAFVIVVPLGIIGGVIAALYAGRGADRIISVTGLSLSSVPSSYPGSYSSWCSA